MRITAIAVAGLVASTLVTASAAQAEVTAQPAQSHFYPLQPPPGPSPDPAAEAQQLREQISELHDNWDSLTPEQRNQQIAQLQQQVTAVDRDTRNLPPDQKAAVEATLLPSAVELADLLGKAQASNPNQRAYSSSAPRRAGSSRRVYFETAFSSARAWSIWS